MMFNPAYDDKRVNRGNAPGKSKKYTICEYL